MAEQAEAEDEPPTLKYQRLGASASEILAKDAATCVCAHDKFLALGTRAGAVHVLDVGGNEIRALNPHSAAVHGTTARLEPRAASALTTRRL